jgi:hypothetical protein
VSVLDQFDEWDQANAAALYRQFVADTTGSTDSPWEKLRAGLYLGGEAFMERVKRRRGMGHVLFQSGVSSSVRATTGHRTSPSPCRPAKGSANS